MRTPARELFARPAARVAPELLGGRLVSTLDGARVEVVVSEVEAYDGSDPASHTYRGPTPRNVTMFGPPGHLYVYFSYGMHFCANAVAHPLSHPLASDVPDLPYPADPGDPADTRPSGGVLLRAGRVVAGIEVARERRRNARGGTPPDARLARGPACLTRCLGIDRAHDGLDLLSPDSPVRLLPPARPLDPARIGSGPRVGVARAADVAWRWWIEGEPSVSAYTRSPRAPAGPEPR